MGVWIEINRRIVSVNKKTGVTPRVGVWIEIEPNGALKHKELVTPRVGVWIEIMEVAKYHEDDNGHSPCGSVD